MADTALGAPEGNSGQSLAAVGLWHVLFARHGASRFSAADVINATPQAGYWHPSATQHETVDGPLAELLADGYVLAVGEGYVLHGDAIAAARRIAAGSVGA